MAAWSYSTAAQCRTPVSAGGQLMFVEGGGTKSWDLEPPEAIHACQVALAQGFTTAASCLPTFPLQGAAPSLDVADCNPRYFLVCSALPCLGG